ncbi:MAG: hypothetical protein NO474_03775 [Methanomassiliicoccales archaeon]|jgi:hypothetical protein|nr:hypothetical protein [Methanomassiliicoccales archaeon]
MKHFDKNGLEGLPLKLMIIFLILSLTMPILIENAEYYDTLVIEKNLIMEAEKIRKGAYSVYLSGPGNLRTIDVEIPKGTFGQLCRLEFGGGMNDSASLMIKCFINDDLCGTIILENPRISIISNSDRPIVIENDGIKLALSCVEIDRSRFVQAEVIPLD